MVSPQRRCTAAAGYMLLEALISILVFAIGILGIVSLHALSLKNMAAAQYRIDASMLANQLFGQMWSSDRTDTNLQTAFQGGPQTPAVTYGTGYTTWLGNAATVGSVMNVLPGVTASPVSTLPTVTVVCMLNGAPDPGCSNSGSRRVTVTLYWSLPGEVEKDTQGNPVVPNKPIIHNYVAVAELNAANQ